MIQETAQPTAPVFEGLPAIFGEAIDPEASRYDLARPWVAGGYIYGTNGRMAVRVPAIALPDSVVALYDLPPAPEKRRPGVAAMFEDYARDVREGKYDDDPTPLPAVPTPYRRCRSCVDAETPIVKCSTCRGKGTLECSECDGSGVAECDMGHEHTCDDCYGDGRIECEDCGGEGKTTCDECEGTRYVEDNRAVAVRLGCEADPRPYLMVAWLVGKLRLAGITEARLPRAAVTPIPGSSIETLNPVRFVFDAGRPGDRLGEGYAMPMSPGAIEHGRATGDDIEYPAELLGRSSTQESTTS